MTGGERRLHKAELAMRQARAVLNDAREAYQEALRNVGWVLDGDKAWSFVKDGRGFGVKGCEGGILLTVVSGPEAPPVEIALVGEDATLFRDYVNTLLPSAGLPAAEELAEAMTEATGIPFDVPDLAHGPVPKVCEPVHGMFARSKYAGEQVVEFERSGVRVDIWGTPPRGAVPEGGLEESEKEGPT